MNNNSNHNLVWILGLIVALVLGVLIGAKIKKSPEKKTIDTANWNAMDSQTKASDNKKFGVNILNNSSTFKPGSVYDDGYTKYTYSGEKNVNGDIYDIFYTQESIATFGLPRGTSTFYTDNEEWGNGLISSPELSVYNKQMGVSMNGIPGIRPGTGKTEFIINNFNGKNIFDIVRSYNQRAKEADTNSTNFPYVYISFDEFSD